MFKRIYAVLWFLALLSPALADVHIVSPLDSVLGNMETAEAGSISAGDSFELIFSSESNYFGGEWSEVVPINIPKDFTVQPVQQNNSKTFVFQVLSEPDTAKGTYALEFEFSNPAQKKHGVSLVVFVDDSLVSASLGSLKSQGVAGGSAKFDALLSNESLAGHWVLIEATLPKQWFEPKEVFVEAKSNASAALEVFPKHSGEKRFEFVVKSRASGKEVGRIEARVFAEPSLENKYGSAEFGFPFYNPGLLAHYFVNYFAALFF